MSEERDMDLTEYDALLLSLNGGGASTPDLDTFQRAWEFDRNFVWRISEGHTHNALESALDEIERLKPRTVTTVGGLDALPVDSTVLDAHGFVYQKWVDLDEPDLPWWALVGDSRQYPARRIALPATVLHEGAQP